MEDEDIVMNSGDLVHKLCDDSFYLWTLDLLRNS